MSWNAFDAKTYRLVEQQRDSRKTSHVVSYVLIVDCCLLGYPKCSVGQLTVYKVTAQTRLSTVRSVTKNAVPNVQIEPINNSTR